MKSNSLRGIDLRIIKESFDKNENGLALLRQATGKETNDQLAIQISYELTIDEIRSRMDSHGYCRGLAGIAESEGWTILAHRIAQVQYEPHPTALLIIEKSVSRSLPKKGFGCPLCHGPLTFSHGEYFCETEGVVCPVIRGIPCLLPVHAIIANKFLVDFPDDAGATA